jgi:uncharacterized protein YbjT (DUF2867 family)
MTILVTGATGNVGRHVVAQLVQAGQRVRALTRNPANANLPEGVEVVYGVTFLHRSPLHRRCAVLLAFT